MNCFGVQSRSYAAQALKEAEKMKQKLSENQLMLLEHLVQYETLDYLYCLEMLDSTGTNDRRALSYAFRPLTKHKYVVKHKDERVNILAKGRALLYDVEPLVTTGGGIDNAKRLGMISRTAMLLKGAGIESCASQQFVGHECFIPSACWRKIRTGILSTTRFAGILFLGNHRLAVYNIGDGGMEWQVRAERSLFYRDYGERETRATGMLFICDDDKRIEVARRIIRTTMWQRKQLIGTDNICERDRPVRYSKAPIRLASQYEHVYLTTPALLESSLSAIEREDDYISRCREDHPKCREPAEGDYENWPYRFFVNIATDLLKFVYYFVAVKSLISFRKEHFSERNYAIVLPRRDFGILNMYPDVIQMEGARFYEYKPQ